MPDPVDQFESIFKRAAKERFHYDRPHIETGLLITDLDQSQTRALLTQVQGFLEALKPGEMNWYTLAADDFDRKSKLIEQVNRCQPDLIVTYRNLRQLEKDTPFSLGAYLDTLAQTTPTPLLVLPDELFKHKEGCLQDTSTVMVVTDHLGGDERLVNYGVRFTQAGGDLHLCHIEDDAAFQYYMQAIEKIPSIDTASAEKHLSEQLLKQPREYIETCIELLKSVGITANLHVHVLMGHTITDYRRLIEGCRADLVVLNSKAEDQLAMHGLAYPIAVEFRHIPLLML